MEGELVSLCLFICMSAIRVGLGQLIEKSGLDSNGRFYNPYALSFLGKRLGIMNELVYQSVDGLVGTVRLRSSFGLSYYQIHPFQVYSFFTWSWVSSYYLRYIQYCSLSL